MSIEDEIEEIEEALLAQKVLASVEKERLPRCGQVCYAIKGCDTLVDAREVDEALERIRQWNAEALARWQKKCQQ